MYTQLSRNTCSSRAGELLGHIESPPTEALQMVMQFSTPTRTQLGASEWESVSQVNSESSSVGSPSSLTSHETSGGACVMQRSVSSHSLQHKNVSGPHHLPFSANLFMLRSYDDAPVRRASSTGDLQRFNGMQHYHHYDSPLSSESSMIIEEMSRTSPYSPEEKKVRIERYRNKRNQRNFTKKIKYACRKTLADSRPRIRGRFARNDEIVMNPPIEWSHGEEEDELEEENWATFFDSLVPVAPNNNLFQDPHASSSSFDVFY